MPASKFVTNNWIPLKYTRKVGKIEYKHNLFLKEVSL